LQKCERKEIGCFLEKALTLFSLLSESNTKDGNFSFKKCKIPHQALSLSGDEIFNLAKESLTKPQSL